MENENQPDEHPARAGAEGGVARVLGLGSAVHHATLLQQVVVARGFHSVMMKNFETPKKEKEERGFPNTSFSG